MNPARLIVGADGMLGGALFRHWRKEGRNVRGTSLAPDAGDVLRLDLSQPPESWPELPPCHTAVLCAAITSLEQCRMNPLETRRVNVTHTLRLAEYLAGKNSFVVFLSSNLVFDGSLAFQKENDPPCPRTEYGRQKAEVEAALERFNNQVAVVRLTKVFHRDLALIRGWRRSLARGERITPFSDLVCSPVLLSSVVSAIAAVAEGHLGGYWQLSGADDTSYEAIARAVADADRIDPRLITPVKAGERAQLEHLPGHSTLDASRAAAGLSFKVLSASETIDKALHET